jgi:eukaryotic-like serine/threonine-protein kinase
VALISGTRLGPYEIVSLLGEGGMGQVYRGRDSKLKRDVAIKILPEAFARDPERLARFEREAEVLATLNHPNIAGVYGFEESPDANGIVLEFVDGQTLADRIARGPIPIDDVLPIARQIVEAMIAAHDQGIVHRDLKPANIKVTPDGKVKVLDFGLAKASDPRATASGINVTALPTITSPANVTSIGTVLGTAAYMSPEQARGRVVDARADIWAFGAVLFEMLTGRRAFPGDDVTETIANIVKTEPDWSALPANTSVAVRALLRRCLHKDPQRRLRHIADARFNLEDVETLALRAQRPSAPARVLPWIVSVLAVAGAGTWVLWPRAAEEGRALVLDINPPAGAEFVLGASGSLAISPDGGAIAFVAASRGIRKLWVRPLDSAGARELPGTEGADQPFWSPDGRSLGFFGEGRLKRIDLAGGPSVVVANASAARGAAWAPDGTIIFTPSVTSGLQGVSAAGGGIPVPLTNLSRGESSHRWPQILPDGKRFLYYVQSADPLISGTYLASLGRPQEKTPVGQNLYNALYAPPSRTHPSYLLFLRENALIARAFDPARGYFSGEAVPVPGAEAVSTAPGINRAHFSVSHQGTLLFAHGNDRYQLTWFNREGKVVSSVGQPDQYQSIRISPDGKGVAVSRSDGGRLDIWRIDSGGGAPNRLTFDGNGYRFAWAPDGRRLFYSSAGKMFETDTNGTGQSSAAVPTQNPAFSMDWSPDGRYLMYEETSPETQADLWIVSARGERKPVAYLKTPFSEIDGQFSPDSKWVAYSSDESGGRFEIYVRAFPAGAAKFPVSNGGGTLPRWRQDGKELFYRGTDGRLMVVSVRPSAQGLEFSSPKALFSIAPPAGIFAYPYDVSPDGQTILALAPAAGEAGASSLTVLVNWQASLKK